MTTKHEFGGSWTEEKLERIRKYLQAYTRLMRANERAKFFTIIYMDAFAGTGYRTKRDKELTLSLFDDHETTSLKKGSAQIALEVEPSFDKYIFVEENPDYGNSLRALSRNHPQKSDKISIINEEANLFLEQWCKSTDWRKTRSVVFLDPYGMDVEWNTIQCIAKTRAIDLWILFPLGQAVNRLLTRKEPPENWANKLTRFFGTDEWKTEFYKTSKRMTLFGEEEIIEKDANFDKIGHYFTQRLESIFPGVAKNPLPLRNSKNVPIFLLCFAASNKKGAKTAVKIAQNILG